MNKFNTLYHTGLENVKSNIQLSKKCLQELEKINDSDIPVNNAKISYLKLRIIYADSAAFNALEKSMFTAPDSLICCDSLIFSARQYLVRSMPDIAFNTLMKAMSLLKNDSVKMEYCRILLSEAYRQKQEYKKGEEILRYILLNDKNKNKENRAFTYNRMAAIYSEWHDNKTRRRDSVIKYSNLCIELSRKIDSKYNLALSQNELACQFFSRKNYNEAIQMGRMALDNFKASDANFEAANTLLNLSRFYTAKTKYDDAIHALVDATKLCKLEANRNLFRRIYLQFAKLYELKGQYADAYDFMKISYHLNNQFYIDRINEQVNEQSARFNLYEKEQLIIKEKQKHEFRKFVTIFLLILIVFLIIIFVLIILYIRAKRKKMINQKLIEAVIETEEKERSRIAADIHDGLGPLLSASKLFFQAYIDEQDKEAKNTIEGKIMEVFGRSVEELSIIAYNISPQMLIKHGLIQALESFVNEIKIIKSIHFDLIYEKINRFDFKKELTIYRTITELINNSLKHSHATLITIRIYISDELLHIIYSDNGVGMDQSEIYKVKSGMGLKNIVNRIHSLKGQIKFENQPKMGMEVIINIPYKEILNNEDDKNCNN